MADKREPHIESKTRMDSIKENLLVIVVLIFSFIYFLIQLYAWFASSQM